LPVQIGLGAHTGRGSAWFRALGSGPRGRRFKSARPDSQSSVTAGLNMVQAEAHLFPELTLYDSLVPRPCEAQSARPDLQSSVTAGLNMVQAEAHLFPELTLYDSLVPRPCEAQSARPDSQSSVTAGLNMESRERIALALRHIEPDRTPIFEYVLQPPVADSILGRQYVYDNRFATYVQEHRWEEAVKQTATDMVELAVKLKHDMIYAPRNSPPPSKNSPQTRCETPPSGPVEDVKLRVERSEATIPVIKEETFFIYYCLKQSMEDFEIDLPILVPAYAHGVWTDTALMQTMLLEPELVHRLYAARTRDTIVLIDKYHSLGIEMFGVGGDFAGTRGPMISPVAYRRFIVPEIRTLSRHIHKLGRFAVNASDGNLWSVIDDFLTGCEVDGYIEIDFFAGMDLGELKKRFGDRITFFGNLDCGNILSFGTIEEVKEHTRQALEKGRGNGGHVLCASNAIIASIPVNNYLAIYEAYREFFGLS
jgi:hypothetical protein